MKKQIWKFPVPSVNRTSVFIPKGANFLTAQMQGDQLMVWVMVDPDAVTEAREFVVVGTGWDIDDSETLEYIDTVQFDNGLVFHVFIKLKP